MWFSAWRTELPCFHMVWCLPPVDLMRFAETKQSKSHILHDVSLDVRKAEIVGLLGRNGVGKSTTLKSIMGIVRPKAGSIKFNNKEAGRPQPYQRAKLR